MAALTWREVTAPNFSGATQSQALAADLLKSGFQSSIDALGKFGKSQDDAANGEFLSRIASYGDADGLRKALSDGSVFNGLDRSAITPETFDRADAHAASLLKDVQIGVQTQGDRLTNTRTGVLTEGDRIRNQGYSLDNDHQSEVNEQLRITNDRGNAQEDARPAAVELVTNMYTSANDGTREGAAKADAAMASGAKILSDAGYGPADIKTIIDNIASTTATGINQNAAFQGVDDANLARDLDNQAIALVAAADKATSTPEEGQTFITENSTDPRVTQIASDKLAATPALFGPGADPTRVIFEQKLAEANNPGVDTPGLSAEENQALHDQNSVLGNQAATLLETAVAGNVFNNDRLLTELTQRPNKGKSDAEIVQDMKTKLGEGVDITVDELTEKFREFQSYFKGMDGDIVAAFMLDATHRNAWGTRWLLGTVDIDEGMAAELGGEFYNREGKTPAERLRPAVQQFHRYRTEAASSEQVSKLQAEVAKAESAYFTAVQRQRTKKDVDIETPRLRLEDLQKKLEGAILTWSARQNPQEGTHRTGGGF
jgi:hypothetical protein